MFVGVGCDVRQRLLWGGRLIWWGMLCRQCVKDGVISGRAKDGICGRVVRELTCRVGR